MSARVEFATFSVADREEVASTAAVDAGEARAFPSHAKASASPLSASGAVRQVSNHATVLPLRTRRVSNAARMLAGSFRPGRSVFVTSLHDC